MPKREVPEQLALAFAARPSRPSTVVEAGAGTGKTTDIVRRVLVLLLDEPGIDPSSIVLMTFTEKAAGEIADRIREGLIALHASFSTSSPGWIDPHGHMLLEVPPSRALAWREACAQRVTQLDRIRSQTIHSFCQNLLRLHPLEAGIDPQFRIVEGFERDRLHEEIYARWLEAETGSGATEIHGSQWALLFHELGSLAAIRNAIFTLLPRRDLVANPRYSLGDPAIVHTRIAEAADALRLIDRRRIEALEHEPQRRIAIHLLDQPLPAGGLDEMIAWITPLAPMFGALHLGKGPRDINAILKGLQDKSAWKRTLPQLLGQHRAAEALRAMSVRLFAFLDEEKVRAGALDFDDLLFRTERLLENETCLAEVRSRYTTIFVDEFQDTDRVQAEIVRRLSTDASGALVPGRTILVGDPKQAIYSFRRADPEMYAATVSWFRRGGAVQQYLDRQFRSDPRLVEALNAFFLRAFGDAEEDLPPGPLDSFVFQPRYKRLEAARGPFSEGDEVRIHLVGSPGEEDRDTAQARAIAWWIESHGGGSGPNGYRRFAVLLRRLTRAHEYAAVLEQHGIPVVVPPGGGLLQEPAVVDLITVLRAIALPFDLGARISAARSPWFALSDVEIAMGRLGLDGEESAWKTVQGALRRYRRLARQLPVAGLMDLLVDESEIETAYAAMRGGGRALAHLERVRGIAAEYEQSTGGSLRQFVDEISRRRAGAAETDPPTIDEEADAVRIMSVHSAKGLEFDTVLLPDLDPQSPTDGFQLSAIDPLETLVISGRLGSISAHFHQTAGVTLREILRLREEAEEQRLFYVAATRARSELVLLCHQAMKKNGFWKIIQETLRAPDLAPLWQEAADGPIDRALPDDEPLLTVRFHAVPEIAAATERPSRFLDPSFDAQVSGWSPVPAEPVIGPALAEREPRRLDHDEMFRRRGQARMRARGILLHRALELWNGDPDQLEPLVLRLRDECRAGTAESESVCARLRRLAASERFRRIANAETIARELPIHYRDASGEVVEGRIDRLIRENGLLRVLDYKSGMPDPARLQEDRQQVIRYRDAISRITGSPCEATLWYIDLERDEMMDVK
ncbi:MAG TPA: UvrD-helicase domain-containing protein [Thermoanaerobaculia bacterium]|nr:UvrD-helicase domain-containing protein [Thermoanaerobaculia bacterium]